MAVPVTRESHARRKRGGGCICTEPESASRRAGVFGIKQVHGFKEGHASGGPPGLAGPFGGGEGAALVVAPSPPPQFVQVDVLRPASREQDFDEHRPRRTCFPPAVHARSCFESVARAATE